MPGVEIGAQCPRRMDPWSKEIVDFFGRSLRSEDAYFDLLAIATTTHDDALHIEWTHKRIRRHIMMHGIQRGQLDIGLFKI